MGTQADEERCHRCGHELRHHNPRCKFDDCNCGGFSRKRIDPESARREADKFIDQAILALRHAFSSDEEIKKEMQEALQRAMRRLSQH